MSYFGNPEDIVIAREDRKRYKHGTGRVSEKEIGRALIRGMHGKGRLLDLSGTNEDKKYGTDLMYKPDEKNRIRIDITLNFSNKNFMPLISDTGTNIGINGTPVKYGIRIGNAYKGFTEFKDPVVIVGFDMPGDTFRKNELNIVEATRNHATEILNAASDVYEQFTNSNREKRKDAEIRLKKNPLWKEPKPLSPHMKELIRQAEKIDRNSQKNHDTEKDIP